MRQALLGPLLFLTLTQSAHPQAADVPKTNLKGWYMLISDFPVGNKWTLNFDGTWRRHNVLESWMQILLRPGVTYQVNDSLSFTGGYSYRWTFQTPESSVRYTVPEHRAWEQITLRQKIGRVDLMHRYRIEQRFHGHVVLTPELKPRVDDWTYQNRFRYAIKGTVPMARRPSEQNGWYLVFTLELFLSSGPTMGAHLFDQVRLYAAIGRSLNKNLKFEFGYMDRFMALQKGKALAHEHVLHLTLLTNYRLR